jgi:hypothetical protein
MNRWYYFLVVGSTFVDHPARRPEAQWIPDPLQAVAGLLDLPVAP